MEQSLKQLKHLQKEIDLLKARLKILENTSVTDVVIGSWPSFPYIEQRQKITGVPQDAPLTRMRNKLAAKVAELTQEQERLLTWIFDINDSEMRQILILYYIDGHSWRKLAREMGYADESVPRKRCARFLAEHKNDRKIRNKVC